LNVELAVRLEQLPPNLCWRTFLIVSFSIVLFACVDDERYGGITFEGEFARPISFERYAGLAVAQVRVDGSAPRDFIVDTGAEYVLLSEAFADELGYGGGALGEYLVVLDELVLGSVTYHDVTAVPYDLSPLIPFFGEDLGGIVGGSLLQYFTFAIDHQREMFFVLDADDEYTASVVDVTRMEGSPLTAGFEINSGLPIARAQVEGSETAEVVIDTGATTTALFQSHYDTLESVTRPWLNGLEGVGAGGAFSTDLTRICGIDIGEAWIDDLPVNVIPDSMLGEALEVFPGLAGLIGFTFMRDFVTVLDYPQGEVRFYRYTEPGYDHESEFVRVGLALEVLPDDVVVTTVYEGTDAEAQGVEEGDVVSTIDGDWARLYDQDEIDALLHGDEGETIVFGLSHRGGSVEDVEVLVEDLLPVCSEWYDR